MDLDQQVYNMNKTELQTLIAQKQEQIATLTADLVVIQQAEWWLENPLLVSFSTGWEYESNDEGGSDKHWCLYSGVYTDGVTEDSDGDEYEERRDSVYDAGYYPGFELIEDDTVVYNPNL